MIAVLYAKASIGMCLCVNIMLARFFCHQLQQGKEQQRLELRVHMYKQAHSQDFLKGVTLMSNVCVCVYKQTSRQN